MHLYSYATIYLTLTLYVASNASWINVMLNEMSVGITTIQCGELQLCIFVLDAI